MNVKELVIVSLSDNVSNHLVLHRNFFIVVRLLITMVIAESTDLAYKRLIVVINYCLLFLVNFKAVVMVMVAILLIAAVVCCDCFMVKGNFVVSKPAQLEVLLGDLVVDF